MEPEVIMPLTIAKYPGHIYKTETGYRIGYSPVNSTEKHSRRFATYDEAFSYLRFLSENEGNKRVKNIIYRDTRGVYSVTLPDGDCMLFDEEDLPFVQSRVWFASTKGYVQSSKKDDTSLSTLFHVCIMGRAPDGQETIHLNQNRRDNRRANMCFRKKTRFTGKKRCTLLSENK